MTVARSVRLGRKGQLVVPKAMRDALGVKAGDDLVALLDGKRVILTRPAEYVRTTRGALKGAWGKDRRAIDRYLAWERGSWR